jgi:CheY-like chemotaxis protein
MAVTFQSAWQSWLARLHSKVMGRVLLVEDHEELQRLLAEIIRELGHEADGVNSSREAQLRLAAGSYDLVIADICLPAGSGYQVAELADALGIKTVLMSGHSDELHLVHLPKPFSLAHFVRLIAEHLGDSPG